MRQEGWNPSTYGVEEHGIHNANCIYWNLPSATLYEHAVRRKEGEVAHLGPLVVDTGHYTGRSPNDKFIVREPGSENHVCWGPVNRPFEAEQFDRLYQRVLAFLQGRDLFVQDCFAGADPSYRKPIRVITELAWPTLSNLRFLALGNCLPAYLSSKGCIVVTASPMIVSSEQERGEMRK